jgi:hypothetical protein
VSNSRVHQPPRVVFLPVLALAGDPVAERPGITAETETEARLRPIGVTLSEYMLYLLIRQPEMLSATAGIGLLRYRDTCAEPRRFFASMDEWVGDNDDARVMLVRVNTSEKQSTVKGDRSKSVLFDAVILAKALRELNNDELMWEVVAGVWREMLTHAAGRCRGEHARAAAQPRRRAHHPRLVAHCAHGARRHVPDTGRGRKGKAHRAQPVAGQLDRRRDHLSLRR